MSTPTTTDATDAQPATVAVRVYSRLPDAIGRPSATGFVGASEPSPATTSKSWLSGSTWKMAA